MSALPEELHPSIVKDEAPIHDESWRPFPVYEPAVWATLPTLRQRIRTWLTGR